MKYYYSNYYYYYYVEIIPADIILAKTLFIIVAIIPPFFFILTRKKGLQAKSALARSLWSQRNVYRVIKRVLTSSIWEKRLRSRGSLEQVINFYPICYSMPLCELMKIGKHSIWTGCAHLISFSTTASVFYTYIYEHRSIS